MAVIVRHPDVEDYITEMSLAEISERGGVADLFEQGRLIIIKDYRLEFDFDALSGLRKSIDSVEDSEMRRRLKKLLAPSFFGGAPPKKRWGKPVFDDPLRQEVYETICNGDYSRFNRASRALKAAHDQTLRIFETCFPEYRPFRFIPSLRLTRTLFENLHWDNHLIEDDFHQARVFANLDRQPRIWNVGRRLPEWMRTNYLEHDLGRFAGKDPNLLIDYVTSEVLGGTRNTWMDSEPRHRIAFEPGEVWLGESRLISHQIVYGESALVYMWFVEATSMSEPENRFNARIEAVHRQMRDQAAAA
jgi:hypothetical protein